MFLFKGANSLLGIIAGGSNVLNKIHLSNQLVISNNIFKNLVHCENCKKKTGLRWGVYALNCENKPEQFKIGM